jgi:NADH:ubiquinone oxidoreductase subunit 6 (subunit J)
MNGIHNLAFFYPIAILMVLFACLSLKFSNLFYSLISAIIVFFSAGILFYILGSEYNAVIQIAVYGIAVPIILGLGIMFSDFTNKNNKEKKKSSATKFTIFLTGGIFVLALIYLFLISYVVVPCGFNLATTEMSATNSLSAFGNGIFINHVWAFELTSLILTIVVVGLSLFKGGQKCSK